MVIITSNIQQKDRVSSYADIEAEFEDIKPLKFLKHYTTHWLSLERCIKRIIDKWPALYAYFNHEANDTDDSGCVC